MDILQVTINELEMLIPLFDAYRQFYRQEQDLERVKVFLKQRIERNESVIFLAREGDKGQGFVQLYPSFSSVSMKRLWVLNDLFVHPDARRKGVGKLLIDRAKQLARDTQAKGLMLETETNNHSAQKLYDLTDFERSTEYFVYNWSNS